MGKMGDFAISEVATRKVSIELFNDKDVTPKWKRHARRCVNMMDGDRERGKAALAACMRDWYIDNRPLDGDCTIYDTLLGWALTAVDWVAIASDFVDAE